MPTPRSGWLLLALGLQGASSAVRNAAVPCAGTVKEIWVGAQVLMTTGNVAVAKGAINLLSATNVSLAASGGDVSAGVAASQTLATAATTKRVAAGDILVATWTVTTAGSFVGGACSVLIEPDTW